MTRPGAAYIRTIALHSAIKKPITDYYNTKMTANDNPKERRRRRREKVERETHNIAARDPEAVEGGSEPEAPIMGLLPCELQVSINNRNSVSVNDRRSFQEAYGRQWNVVCCAFESYLFHGLMMIFEFRVFL